MRTSTRRPAHRGTVRARSLGKAVLVAMGARPDGNGRRRRPVVTHPTRPIDADVVAELAAARGWSA